MRKRMYKCTMSVLAAALFFLPYTSAMPVTAQEAEQSIAAADETAELKVTSTYTDNNGVTYSWYGYEDDTAEIYQVDFSTTEIVMEIPRELDGYTVTKISTRLNEKTIQSLTIPDSITLFGENTFEKCIIGVLYFNAVDAVTGNDVLLSPFYDAEIGEIFFSDMVEIIEPYVFCKTTFRQEKIELEIPQIKSMAFNNVSIKTLTITDQVQKLETKAFIGTEIQQLHFNSPDVTVGTSSNSEGPFDDAVIYNLDFCKEMTEIPDYLFACAHFKMQEFTFTQERIGTYAFWRAWNSTVLDDGADKADRITLTADVKTLGESAFLDCHIEELVIESNLETEANGTSNSPFYDASVYELILGSDVTKLPDFLFSYAYFQMPELMLDIPYIGTACFYGAWMTNSGNVSPVALTITEDVEYIGASAFANNKISKLQYMTNAVNGSASSADAPFQSSEVAELEIGENVTEIQPLLFANVEFTQDIELTIDVPIGNYAFYSSGASYNGFTNLTIGENVTSMGKGAFQRRNIGSLSFEAIFAPNQLTNTNEGPFYSCVIGELAFGEKVELLDKALLCGVELKQEELVIPDSVQEIGDYFIYNMSFLNDGVVVDTLRIGERLKKLTDHSFHQASFTNIYMEAVEFTEDFKLTLPSSASGYLPVSENLYIHRGSDFYDYFSRNAEEENYYCEGHMVTTVGDEVLDKENKRFETTTFETCSVCGYQTESSEYEDAYTVTFMAMEKEVAVLYCKLNGGVEAPEAPQYSGYTFERWDKSFDNITVDTVVTAIYSEISEPVYQVTVHAVYADGSESEYTSFDAKNGEVITLPVYEGSLPKNLLDGYEGERQFAPEFIWNVETDGGTYTVTGEKEIVATEGNFYEVKFVADDGSVISTQKVPSGYDAVPPVIEGDTVGGGDAAAARSWEKNYYNVTSDREVRLESVEEPGETPDPDDGKEPGETPNPDDGKEPGETPDPGNGQHPTPDTEMEPSAEPEVTPTPPAASSPDTQKSPAPSDNSEVFVARDNIPQTGDSRHPGLWLAMLVLSLVVMGMSFRTLRRKRFLHEEEKHLK